MPKPTNSRTRKYHPLKVTGKVQLIRNGIGPISDQRPSLDLTGTQTTVSEGHQWPPPKGAPLSDRGGPFFTTRTYVEGNPFRFVSWSKAEGAFFTHKYEGPLFACYPPTDAFGSMFPPANHSSKSSLEALGSTAIARSKPTNSVANVATFLGETLKDGIPSMIGARSWESRASAAKKAGDEYLNAAFGWLPLVNDIRKVAEAVKHADAVLAQYERDAGGVVRRRYNFPLTDDATTETVGAADNALPFAAHDSAWIEAPFGRVTRKVETSRSRSFSGAFTYYLPTDYDSRKELARVALEADKLFGLAITPEVLWELAPWSWAVDWFSNIGDVVSNISDFITDGLVLRYGYISERSVTKYTYTSDPSGLVSPYRDTKVPPLVLVRETKQRIPANPFGFGIGWEGLSAFQLSIAAALGISRR